MYPLKSERSQWCSQWDLLSDVKSVTHREEVYSQYHFKSVDNRQSPALIKAWRIKINEKISLIETYP